MTAEPTAETAAARMVTWVKEHAWMGEWGDLLADNPGLRTFDALADVHWFQLWHAAGFDEPPRDQALRAETEQRVNAALAALPAGDLRPAEADPAETAAIAAAAATAGEFAAWTSAGSPAHGFAGTGVWCSQCGCGPDGWQHQPGGTPPPPPPPWT